MALTTEQEQKITELLAAFENGKRISDLSDAQGAVGDMQIEVMDESGETRKMMLGEAVETASNPIAGRYWNEANSTPTAAGITAACRRCVTCRRSSALAVTS